eukprot:284815626_2
MSPQNAIPTREWGCSVEWTRRWHGRRKDCRVMESVELKLSCQQMILTSKRLDAPILETYLIANTTWSRKTLESIFNNTIFFSGSVVYHYLNGNHTTSRWDHLQGMLNSWTRISRQLLTTSEVLTTPFVRLYRPLKWRPLLRQPPPLLRQPPPLLRQPPPLLRQPPPLLRQPPPLLRQPPPLLRQPPPLLRQPPPLLRQPPPLLRRQSPQIQQSERPIFPTAAVAVLSRHRLAPPDRR